MFTLSHSQYIGLDLYNFGNIAGVLFSTLIMGWLRYQTGSLIPAIVIHAILNTPTGEVAMYVVPILMIVVMLYFRNTINEQMRQFWQRCIEIKPGVMDVMVTLLLSATMLGLSLAPQLTMQLGMLAIPVNLIYLLILGWRKRASDKQEANTA